jgi:ABC-2 type transport system ATP-binding protein
MYGWCYILLNIVNVTKSFNYVQALRDITFSIVPGEIVGLIGANGAGKTTTLRLITRYFSPDSGEIHYNGKSISNMSPEEYMISYIPDEPVYYEFMTVAEHLRFIHAMYPHGEYGIEQVIERFSLQEELHKTPHLLSKGNKQKLMICTAIIRGFDLLVADEPFTGLDPKQLNVLKQIFKELRDRGKGVLISTHLLDVIDLFCDRYVMIEKGSVVATGTKGEIAHEGGLDCNLTIEQMYIALTH